MDPIDSLDPSELRRRIGRRRPLELITGDADHRRQAEDKTQAAVLVGIVAHPTPTVILTQRTAHLRDHAGQISFPGGRVEDVDQDVVATALRETEEEVGLQPHHIDILGTLPPYDTITGYRVHPVVGWIDPPVAFEPDPHEVADVFEVPLAFILDSSNHERDSYLRGAVRRWFWVMRWQQRYIWGATAAMLVNFSRLVDDPAGIAGKMPGSVEPADPKAAE